MAYSAYVKGQIVWSTFLREMKGQLPESEYIKKARSEAVEIWAQERAGRNRPDRGQKAIIPRPKADKPIGPHQEELVEA